MTEKELERAQLLYKRIQELQQDKKLINGINKDCYSFNFCWFNGYDVGKSVRVDDPVLTEKLRKNILDYLDQELELLSKEFLSM